MALVHVRRGMLCAVILTSALVGAGCTTPPKTEAQKAEARQVLQERMDDKLAEADQAVEQGKTDDAMRVLDEAARLDPASKQPWLKRAQIRFDARQYGEAITNAHEVLQRDVNDLTAQSILAVSGLRVSAQALDELRKANEVSGSARSEAETVAKLIKEVLGEPILVSGSEAAPKPVRRTTRSRRSSAPVVASPPASEAPAVVNSVAVPPTVSSRPAAPAAPRPAPAATSRGNPFGALQ